MYGQGTGIRSGSTTVMNDSIVNVCRLEPRLCHRSIVPQQLAEAESRAATSALAGK